jgi:RES domain-containing protein
MLLYRLVKSRYSDEVLSGVGGLVVDGRWHTAGRRIVYTATSEALAVLELRVHLGRVLPRAAFTMQTIEVGDEGVQALRATDLPRDWARVPAPPSTRQIGDRWLTRGATLALRVPSIHVASEGNVLLNPSHAGARTLRVVSRRPYALDSRLFGSA